MIFGRVMIQKYVKKDECFVRMCTIIKFKHSLDESEVCVLWKFLILEEN